MPKVNVLFKQTSKDMKLYTTVKGQREQSEFVKRALEFYIKYLENRFKKWCEIKKIKPSRRLDLFQVAKSVLRLLVLCYTTFLAYSRGMKKLCILGALR